MLCVLGFVMCVRVCLCVVFVCLGNEEESTEEEVGERERERRLCVLQGFAGENDAYVAHTDTKYHYHMYGQRVSCQFSYWISWLMRANTMSF